MSFKKIHYTNGVKRKVGMRVIKFIEKIWRVIKFEGKDLIKIT